VRRLPWRVSAVAFVVAGLAVAAPSLLPAPVQDAGSIAPLSQSSSLASSEAPDIDGGVATAPAPYGGVPAAAQDAARRPLEVDGPQLIAEVSQAPAVVIGAGAGTPGIDVLEPAAPVAGLGAPAAAIERWAAAEVVIATEGQVLDEYSLANIDAALGILPAGVLGALGNPAFGPLHILVNAEGRTLSGDQPYRGPANFFSTNEGTNELVLYPQQSVFTIVHELGHAYNLRNVGAGRYAMVLLDPEMRSFLAAAGWVVTSSAAEIQAAVDHMHVGYSYAGAFHWPRVSNDDPLEDFANSFATFFLDPDLLRDASPERYAWMAATFGE
jgi:hypothetical protein